MSRMKKQNGKKSLKTKDGITLYYEVYGTDTAGTIGAKDATGGTENGDHSRTRPVLFFVHGVGGDLDAWQYVRDGLLEKGFSSIAMDLRGHGKSDHPRSSRSYRLEYFIEDVIAIIEAEKIHKVILIGHSLGAVLTTHVAIRHQEKIERLILISSSYLPPPYFKWPGMLMLFDLLAAISPPPFRPGHSVYPPGKHHKDVEMFGLMRTIARNSLKSYLLSSKEILWPDLAESLRTIQVPTLLISGDKDSVFPFSISEYIHSQIPHSQLNIIPGANHVVVLNNIDATVRYIGDFLGDLAVGKSLL